MAKEKTKRSRVRNGYKKKEHCITEPELQMPMESRSAYMRPPVKNYYEKQLEARRQVEEIIFRRKHPTDCRVLCKKWLLMQSAKVSAATMKGYNQNMRSYVIKSLGDMYMEEVTADDIRLALVPLSKKVGRIIRYGKYVDQVCFLFGRAQSADNP